MNIRHTDWPDGQNCLGPGLENWLSWKSQVMRMVRSYRASRAITAIAAELAGVTPDEWASGMQTGFDATLAYTQHTLFGDFCVLRYCFNASTMLHVSTDWAEYLFCPMRGELSFRID